MTPLTSELTWRTALDNLSAWRPLDIKTLIITPHPDDETLGAGGLIADLVAKGIDVTLIAVTDGENAYEKKNNDELALARMKEQENALSILGLPNHKIIRLRLTDSNIAASEHLLENYLLSIIDKPVNLFATWHGDFHPDHEVVGRVAQRVAKQTNSFLTYYFFWTWHRGDLATIENLPLKLYRMSNEAYQLKQAAIQCYHSQLTHPVYEPILPPALLQPTQRPYEVYLPA